MKKNFIRIGFLILLVITIYLVSSILSIKSEHGVDQTAGLYWQPDHSIDVAMMGTSHIHCNVNTALLWEKYGIASYDYSGAEQPLWMSYYYLRELYKYQSPQVVVLDLYAPARFKEDYQYHWISENIYGMKFSLNKVQMLLASVELPKISRYFPDFAIYHNRYDELVIEDFHNFFWNRHSKEAFKGYTPYWNKTAQERPAFTETESSGLTPKSEKYLKKMIAYTKKQGSELLLIAAPYIITPEDKKTYNQIEKIAAEYDVPFLDFNEYYDEIGLDFNEDFNDDSHLNYWGSCKFSDYLGELLCSAYQLPDRRGQEKYASWDENVQVISEELESYEAGEQP